MQASRQQKKCWFLSSNLEFYKTSFGRGLVISVEDIQDFFAPKTITYKRKSKST